MDGATFLILSMGLTHGTLIILGLRELWLLRRGGGGGPGRLPEPEPTPRPRDSGRKPPLPNGSPKPLPDCLIPRPLSRPRVREPELV
jgi:hypothetical protein